MVPSQVGRGGGSDHLLTHQAADTQQDRLRQRAWKTRLNGTEAYSLKDIGSTEVDQLVGATCTHQNKWIVALKGYIVPDEMHDVNHVPTRAALLQACPG